MGRTPTLFLDHSRPVKQTLSLLFQMIVENVYFIWKGNAVQGFDRAQPIDVIVHWILCKRNAFIYALWSRNFRL